MQDNRFREQKEKAAQKEKGDTYQMLNLWKLALQFNKESNQCYSKPLGLLGSIWHQPNKTTLGQTHKKGNFLYLSSCQRKIPPRLVTSSTHLLWPVLLRSLLPRGQSDSLRMFFLWFWTTSLPYQTITVFLRKTLILLQILWLWKCMPLFPFGSPALISNASGLTTPKVIITLIIRIITNS